ncbi:SprT-like domain-containing protein [Roseivirga sp. E12]|uniref:SprT-like domain-containing protein n=1 Tax=Roseivirga sp. E12 TaxID=2819237 RepID=UPI001F1FAEAA|nr:SprT-like domain-containing protein [Roseivirga sp. E12]
MREVLIDKVPASALDYCHQLWSDFPFDFKLTKSRSSKLGDYRYDPDQKSHIVTVNEDLNTYQFLITYVHEVAHRVVHNPRGRQKPHGIEWKMCFQRLMLPLLRPEVFPEDILRVLARHMKNPKASSSADPKLLAVLSEYDESKIDGTTLKELELDTEFMFRTRAFRKLQEKRTRAVCLELNSQRRYLIPMVVEVEVMQ